MGDEYAALRLRQRAAMAEQMAIDAEQLDRLGSSLASAASAGVAPEEEEGYPAGKGAAVAAAVTGTVWELRAAPGAAVKAGDTLMVLEAMKMEYSVTSPVDGVLAHVRVKAGDMVQQGTALCLVTPAAKA